MAASLHARRLHAAVNYWQGDPLSQSVVDPFVQDACDRLELCKIADDLDDYGACDTAAVKEIVRAKRSQHCANAVRGRRLGTPILGRRVVLQCNSWVDSEPLCLAIDPSAPASVHVCPTALPLPSAPTSPSTPKDSFETWADGNFGLACKSEEDVRVPDGDVFDDCDDDDNGSCISGGPALSRHPHALERAAPGAVSGLKRPQSAAAGAAADKPDTRGVKRPASAAPVSKSSAAAARNTRPPAAAIRKAATMPRGGAARPGPGPGPTAGSFSYPPSTRPSSATMVKQLEMIDGSDAVPDKCMWVIQESTDPRRRKASAPPQAKPKPKKTTLVVQQRPPPPPEDPDEDADVPSFMLQSYERKGEYLCYHAATDRVSVSALDAARLPHEAFEFIFVETVAELYIILPKCMKGAALRGWGDTREVATYTFRSGRVRCPWKEGLGGAVDDFLTPNTCEWAVTSVSSTSGITVAAPLAKLPRALRGTKEKTVSLYLKSLYYDVYLSCRDGVTLSLAPDCTTFEMFTFHDPTDAELYWTAQSQQFQKFTTSFKLLPASPAVVPGKPPPPEGPAYVLATRDLAYVSVVKRKVRDVPEYVKGSLWTVHAYVLDSYDYLSSVQRRVVGLFPGQTSTKRAQSAASYRDNLSRVAKQRRKKATEKHDTSAADVTEELQLKLRMKGFKSRLPRLYSTPGYVERDVLPSYLIAATLIAASFAQVEKKIQQRKTRAARRASVAAALCVICYPRIIVDEVAQMELHLEQILNRLDTKPPGYIHNPLTNFRNPLRPPSISQ
eukprot:TRINITY_DN11905_c0_g1_i1.p1 TRINITY_DN11905_c0_g1~~TRINITY_DN11905_c0_g1_i1.p1  ORF type:complete len:785 (+),score=175.16 TRINITY_DN11905_c0_g1_i1:102-2456(+)